MKLIQRNLVYWVDFRAPTGKRHRLSTGETDKQTAQLRAGDIVRSYMATSDSTSVATERTLGEHLDKHYAAHWAGMKSRIVMRHVVNVLKREVGYRPLSEITYGCLKDYGDGLLVGRLKPATVNRRMSAISSTLQEAVRRGELEKLPPIPHWPENNRKERYMTQAEEAAIFGWLGKRAEAARVMGDTSQNEWEYMRHLAQFLVDTGFRFSEAFKFDVVDGQANLLHGDTKTGSGRRVPLTSAAKVSAEYMLGNAWHTSSLTPEQRWSYISHRWELACKAAGVAGVTLHILRHTCASRLVQRGVNIYVVSKWLGHSSVRTTERYAKLAPDTLSLALAALERGPVGVESLPLVELLHDTRLLHSR